MFWASIKIAASERALFFLARMLLVSIRAALPLACLYIAGDDSRSAEDFAEAWTYGFIALAIYSAGFHDVLLRGEGELLINRFAASITWISIHAFFVFLAFSVFCYFASTNFSIILFNVLLLNFIYSISLLLERYLLYRNKVLVLLAYSCTVFFITCLIFGLAYLKEVESLIFPIFFLAAAWALIVLVFTYFSVSWRGLSYKNKLPLLKYYRDAFPLAVQVVALSVTARLEQYIFISSSDGKSIVEYFLIMRLVETLYVFLGFNSQYNLIRSFSANSPLRVKSYLVFASVLMIAAIVLGLLASYAASKGVWGLELTPYLFHLGLLSAPLVIVKAAYNYKLDYLKRKSLDRQSIKLILIGGLLSMPAAFILIDTFGIYGALMSAYVFLLVFLLVPDRLVGGVD
jgi:hypothetical protein